MSNPHNIKASVLAARTINREGEVEMDQQNMIDPVEEMRQLFHESLEISSRAGDSFASQMKVLDLGATKEAILNAATSMGKFSKDEGFVMRLTKRIPGLGGLAERMKKDLHETIIEGKSVRDVASELIESLTAKRDHTMTTASNLTELSQQMILSYNNLQEIAEETKRRHDEAPDHKKIAYSSLLIEIVETMDYVKENIRSAAGTIKGSELAVQQVSGMIPKLRAVLQDSMVVRKALNDLEELGELTTLIDETCRVIRDDNQIKMEQAILGVLDRSVISNDQMKQIEGSAKRSANFQQTIEKKLQTLNARQIEATQRLLPIVSGQIGQETSGFLQLESDADPKSTGPSKYRMMQEW